MAMVIGGVLMLVASVVVLVVFVFVVFVVVSLVMRLGMSTLSHVCK